MGIWARGMSSSQINYCYRSNNGKWVRDPAPLTAQGVGAEAVASAWQVVSADHSGLVRLNNYPAVCAYTPCFAHRGHASHVTRTPSPPQPSAPSAGCAAADGRCGLQLCYN